MSDVVRRVRVEYVADTGGATAGVSALAGAADRASGAFTRGTEHAQEMMATLKLISAQMERANLQGESLIRNTAETAVRIGAAKSASGGLAAGLAGARNEAQGLFGGLGSVVGALDHAWSLGSRLVDTIAGMAGKVIGLQSEAQDTSIAIAGMLQAGGATGARDFQSSLGLSTALIAKMREHARDLPGEFSDLMSVMRGGLGGGLAAGKSVNEIEATAARLMAVGKTLQLPSDQVGREFAELLEGRAGAHNTLFLRLRAQIGLTAEEFNKLGSAKQFDAIGKALEGYAPAVDAFANTWSAVSSATTDYAQELLRVGGEPIFKAALEIAKEINSWYERSRDEIQQTARAIGGELATAAKDSFGYLRTALGWIVEHKDALIAVATAYAGMKFAGVSPGSALGKVGVGSTTVGAIGEAVAKGVAAAAINHATSPLDTGPTILMDAAAGVAGALSMIPGPLGAFGTALSVAIPALNAFISWLDKGIGEAIHTGLSKDEINYATTTGGLDRIGELSRTRQRLTNQAELNENAREQWKAALPYLTRAKDLGVLNPAAALGAEALDQSKLGRKLGALGYEPGEIAELTRQYQQAVESAAVLLPERFKSFAGTGADAAAAALATPGKGVPGKGSVNVTQHIYNTINEAENPERVLVKLGRIVEDAVRRPLESPYTLGGVIR